MATNPTYKSASGYDITPIDWQAAYGGRPNVPLTATDTSTVTGTDKLGQLIASQPDFLENLGGYIGNIASNLGGKVSTGTTNQLAQQAAEWGTGRGMALSPAVATGFLNKYGLASEGLTKLGGEQFMDLMTKWPYTETQTTQNVRDLGLERSIYLSAPDPAAAAAAAMAAARAGTRAGGGSVGAGGVSFPNAAYEAPIARTAGVASSAPSYYVPVQSSSWNKLFEDDTPDYGDWSSGYSLPAVYDTSDWANLGTGTAYGQMPDYSQPGPDPMAAALGGGGYDYGSDESVLDWYGW